LKNLGIKNPGAREDDAPLHGDKTGTTWIALSGHKKIQLKRFFAGSIVFSAGIILNLSLSPRIVMMIES
jgi:hypothetical protein